MHIRIASDLPFVCASITFKGKLLTFDNVLIDTGSSASIFKADKVSDIGLFLEPADSIHRVLGVGGSEFVFTKILDKAEVGDFVISNFEVEIGAMDYGFDIDGIIGLDFLIGVKAVIDFAKLEIYSQGDSSARH